MLVIIDYGVGNVRSVTNAFRHIGADITVSCDPQTIRNAAGLILPGVGASGYAMEKDRPAGRAALSAGTIGQALPGNLPGLSDHVRSKL